VLYFRKLKKVSEGVKAERRLTAFHARLIAQPPPTQIGEVLAQFMFQTDKSLDPCRHLTREQL
jgi:hypothetical protein